MPCCKVKINQFLVGFFFPLHLFTAIWQSKLWFVYQQEIKILQFVDYLESAGYF